MLNGLLWQSGLDLLEVLIARSWWWLVALSILGKKGLPLINKRLKMMKVHILTILFFCSFIWLIYQVTKAPYNTLWPCTYIWSTDFCPIWSVPMLVTWTKSFSCYICCSLPWYAERLSKFIVFFQSQGVAFYALVDATFL